MPATPQQLGHAGRPGVPGPPQCAQGVPPHHPQLGPLPHEPLAHHGVLDRPRLHGGPHHPPQLLGEPDLLGQRRHAPLESEQTHRDLPATALAPDDVLHARVGPVEEHLIEVAGPRQLPNGPHLYAPRLVHGHEQERQPAMPDRLGVRAGEHEAPVGLVGERRPDLLPGDPVHPVRPELGLGPNPREIRPGAGFAVPLTPQLVPGRDGRQETTLLRLGPVRDESGREKLLPDVPGPRRRPRPRVLLGPDDLLGEGGAPVAVSVLGPTEPYPPGFAKHALPTAAVLSVLGVLIEPRPRFRTKRFVLRREPEVHRGLLVVSGQEQRPSFGGASSQALGRAPSAAARAIASTRSSIGIGSTPTDPGRHSAIRCGVQDPSAYAARSSRGCAHTAIFGPATV